MTEVRPTIEADPAPLPEAEPCRSILCKECDHPLTHLGRKIEAEGSYEHTFRNPAGYSFHVVCFSEAPGCQTTGVPTRQATWFKNYAWSFAACHQCGQHVGWLYTGLEDEFFGLIATRLKGL